ncbi:acetyl-CoA carboxylase biotin carboxylase subunit [Desulfosporosinus burensis]
MEFKKILIANRGEIARRVINTCRKMGIKTVAVYSEADQEALHVREADESVLIGPAPVAQSYLNSKAIISAARETGADAIHPGYGLLSENGDFAAECEKSGIIFIGPSSQVISDMGSKIEARRKMMALGVPVVPGSEEAVESLEEALELARKIGYPVMLKASAGGGGVGISILGSPEELEKGFQNIRDRSRLYFGNPTVLLEKFIESPRHIEVQIAADQFGNVVHLFERECSVQRRHQKVLEESPSPFLSEDLRKRLLASAIQGVKGIGYRNLGTMEFIFGQNGEFYFLEMNTRLQVEHPVTEAVTGLDLVEWQIRIAQGEQLPLSQDQISSQGHAMECRIYAEDPVRLIPSPGTISRLAWPMDGVRIDAAVEEGSVVSQYYDPMIAKLVVRGEDRQETIGAMNRALSQTQIEGIKNNISLLLNVVHNDEFIRGNYSTGLIADLQNATKKKGR